MAIAVGNFDAQFRPDSLLAQAWARVGATAAPTNQAAGDLTVSRLFVTDGALDSEARIAQIIDAYTPGAGAFNTMYVKTNITPAAMTATDEQRSAKFEVNVRPTANYAGTATGFYAEADHDSGAFNIATVQGFFTQAIHSVAATTVTTLRAARVAYRPNLGTTTTAVGLEITRGLSADAGTLGTGIGLLISASDTVIPTTDIAIQSLGGTHRFVGGLNLGSNADPATGNLLDIHGNAVIDNESVIRSRDAGGTIRDLFKMGSDDIVSFFVAGGGTKTLRFVNQNISAELWSINNSGDVQFGSGKVGFYGTAPIVKQASAADLTNSVTAGGTTDTIANFTDLTTYANSAAAIRNDIYQLARKLKQVNDALRAYGLLT